MIRNLLLNLILKKTKNRILMIKNNNKIIQINIINIEEKVKVKEEVNLEVEAEEEVEIEVEDEVIIIEEIIIININ